MCIMMLMTVLLPNLDGQTLRITGPSSAGGRLCLLSKFQERKMNVFMAPPRTYLFSICQGGPLCYIVTKKVVQHYRNTQFCIIGDGSPTIPEQPTARTKIDQSYTFWGIDRPYILSSFPSRGGSSRVINAFSWFSSADKYFSSLFEDLVEKMSTAHIWTVACWGVWRGASSPQFVNAKLIIWTPPQQPIKASQNTNRKVCKCQMIISFSSSASKSLKLPVFLNVPLL